MLEGRVDVLAFGRLGVIPGLVRSLRFLRVKNFLLFHLVEITSLHYVWRNRPCNRGKKIEESVTYLEKSLRKNLSQSCNVRKEVSAKPTLCTLCFLRFLL